MLVEAMLAAWLSAQAPAQECFILGEVSAAQEEATHLQSTGCPITIRRTGKIITMISSKWIVQVTIPEAPGSQKFLYQWGQSEATIGDRNVEVTYRPAGGG
jgi:hypothetical protein